MELVASIAIIDHYLLCFSTQLYVVRIYVPEYEKYDTQYSVWRKKNQYGSIDSMNRDLPLGLNLNTGYVSVTKVIWPEVLRHIGTIGIVKTATYGEGWRIEWLMLTYNWVHS